MRPREHSNNVRTRPEVYFRVTGVLNTETKLKIFSLRVVMEQRNYLFTMMEIGARCWRCLQPESMYLQSKTASELTGHSEFYI